MIDNDVSVESPTSPALPQHMESFRVAALMVQPREEVPPLPSLPSQPPRCVFDSPMIGKYDSCPSAPLSTSQRPLPRHREGKTAPPSREKLFAYLQQHVVSDPAFITSDAMLVITDTNPLQQYGHSRFTSRQLIIMFAHVLAYSR